VQVEQPSRVVHPTETQALQQFMEWLLQVAVLLVVEHQHFLLVDLWVAVVVAEMLMALRTEQA
jgi:hypothetical protein